MAERGPSRIKRFRSQLDVFLSSMSRKHAQRVPLPMEEAAKIIKEASHVARGTGTGPAHRTSPVDRDIGRIAADGYEKQRGA